jgi:signal peptidase II
MSLAVFLLFTDRYLKHLVSAKYDYKIFGDWFQLDFAANYGIAFSLPLGGQALNWLVLVILFGLVYFAYISLKRGSSGLFLAIFAIFLGATSNLYDRLSHGYVIDYFDLKYFTVFNLADVMIFFGVIGLILLKPNYLKKTE